MSSDYKEHACDLCGSSEAVEVPYARLYTGNQPIHICTACGLVYVKKRRSAKAIADSWSDELYGELYTARSPAVKARQIYVAEFADSTLGLRGKRVVDIGAGEGRFLRMLREEYGAEVFGIEPSVRNCEEMTRDGTECFQGTIEEYAGLRKVQHADVVTILWTLEACQSSRGMLQSAHEILRDNGHIVIGTGSRISVPFKKTLRDYIGMENSRPVDTHPLRFSFNTLRGILAVNGFEMVYVNRYRDSEYLCMIGKKKPKDFEIPWKGDDMVKVFDFFERWHRESGYYHEESL
ncbi:MAG: class I SAM-dependent methyltransferase [Thermodesulfobacteriota bacterium]